ncbi:dicarboxylate/amino acid:cation symporter [Bacillus sp. FJAT-42376]|uniref:dicarboxylate/amino acid:cation symporter n=1 Tax=Bacillus sp. FJAT-42376 TaxID=2014076 RepID=UPI000F4F447A|nr:dicarboxylate/amino acid:cation symporter [Bacillus sp. FJAT-42376]AZB42216.1 dicarboxylate/amino acid:cation symporter [Bacillus sp. FJAT-42376]
MKLSTKILIGLVSGIAVGLLLNLLFPSAVKPVDTYFFSPVGQAFIRIIQFIVVPVVFASLIIGLTSLKGTGKVGAYTVKLVPLYIVTSIIALGAGLLVAAILKPGAGVSGLQGAEAKAEKSQSILEWLVSIVPMNPFEALAEANLLQVIISAILIGAAINMISAEKGRPFVSFIESLYAITEKILQIILKAAPVGVFALIASVTATQGLDIISKLGLYVIGLLLAIFLMIGLYALILLAAGARPKAFFQSLSPAFILAFGTASSNAALPVAMENIQERYKMNKMLASFALPFGTAVKRDGAAVFQGFNALFVAQLFDVAITPSLIAAVFISALLVSFSTAGVPGAGIIMMTTVLAAANLPLEAIAMVAGVDRLTDGFRTSLNVIGNAANAAILNRWEKSE